MKPKYPCLGSGMKPAKVRLRSVHGATESVYECRTCKRYVLVRRGVSRVHAARSVGTHG